MHDLPRTPYKEKAEKLEVALAHAQRRAAWAETVAKAAKFDLAEAREEIERLKRLLKAPRQATLFPQGRA
ncbi:MAG: hypothetical protein KUA35_10385 [Pseudodesulfovibrio sp.]|uniref:Uncharacterized protein n=1 Tax=Pseudodesulfovibrio aespoeensis (strain ATCC 700646 / DSM 10631 / Aspo-2) TaxID=643562 RepID=E6VUD1_PSEA9|nr:MULTISPECIES: hypothetical protein [Pseudodesulfovibrio]MBU4192239.1 hypothetical protein [Pseudomonadota bacterium]ADU63438.1 hypothetical protein Daes_2433 [Pseudodesulfovibrio aespoeensis Aspo-2]MBU4243485.1 hypothetical protein [Pseudomonadota bacterium]MBU4380256.1 hypothetical protein [Pseudomonadota bacterium]MBU4473819.1 hypothetical protein [Pseudomonadota bacterium]